MKKEPLLSELSGKSGHSAGDETWCIKHKTRVDLPIVERNAHTAMAAFKLAQLDLAGAAYSDVRVWRKSDGMPDGVCGTPPVEVETGRFQRATIDLMRRVNRLEEVVDVLLRRINEDPKVPGLTRYALGEQRSKASPAALAKLIPKRKAKRGKSKVRRSSRR